MKTARLLLAFCLVCLPLLAYAAPEASYPDGEPLQLRALVLDDPYDEYDVAPRIVRITAPNGQEIHLISMMAQPWVHGFDVNFDGEEDLVIGISRGASNAAYRLFIQQQGRYVPVNDGMEEGLFNVAFYPQQQLVGTSQNHGQAGALHENVLLKWEGTRLIPLRRAVCRGMDEAFFEGDAHVYKTWDQMLISQVLAHTAQDGTSLLFEEYYDMHTQGMEDAYLAFYQREQDALWMGME